MLPCGRYSSRRVDESPLDFSKLPYSQRELQVLLLAAEGMTDKDIATHTNLSAGSVRTYWERIRTKAGTRSRAEAVAKALRAAYEAAAEQLREANDWMRVMIESSKDYAIFRTDRVGTLMSWNVGVFELLGYGEDEFIGKNTEILFTDADRLAEMPQQERTVALQTGRSLDDRWHVRKEGTKIWIEGTLVRLEREGNCIGFAKIMQDRSEEYQARREVERLVNLKALEEGTPTNPAGMDE